MNRLTDGIIHLSVEQNWNFKNTIACFYDIPHSNYVIVICIARLFYGGVCFAGMFILRCCSLQLSGHPTASNKHHFSLYVKTFFFLSVFFFFFNKSPGALWAALLQSACYVYLQQHISLVLWSLFLHMICLCLTGPALLKWWRGVQSVWEGDLLFVWCVYGFCSYLLSAGSSRTENCEENLIKSDKFSPCSNMCNRLTLGTCRICVVECYNME